MKMFLLSDNVDTLIGMRLVGIEGVIVHTKEELESEIALALDNTDYGILLIVENLSKLVPQSIKDIRLNRSYPLIVEIPDRHGTARSKDFITNYVREAIGVKL